MSVTMLSSLLIGNNECTIIIIILGILMRYAIALFLVFVIGPVNAAPVVWTLNDVTFEYGGTAVGSFTFDADTGIYSEINIQTSNGPQNPDNPIQGTSGFLGATHEYLLENTTAGENLRAYAGNPSPLYALNLDWAGGLSNQGGSIELLTGAYSFEYSTVYGYRREVTGGSISAVPVPAAVWLFGSALAGLGWFRRRA